jgi:hypothetical protein
MLEIGAMDISIQDFSDEDRRKAEADGVDLTLLIENLRLTPTERVRRLERFARAVLMLQAEAQRGQAKEATEMKA